MGQIKKVWTWNQTVSFWQILLCESTLFQYYLYINIVHLSDTAEVNLQVPAIISEWLDRVKLGTCQACWTDLTLSNLTINSGISGKHHMLLFMALAAEEDYIHLYSFKKINIKMLYWFINDTQITDNHWTTGSDSGSVSVIQLMDLNYESEMLINMHNYLNMLL